MTAVPMADFVPSPPRALAASFHTNTLGVDAAVCWRCERKRRHASKRTQYAKAHREEACSHHAINCGIVPYGLLPA